MQNIGTLRQPILGEKVVEEIEEKGENNALRVTDLRDQYSATRPRTRLHKRLRLFDNRRWNETGTRTRVSCV